MVPQVAAVQVPDRHEAPRAYMRTLSGRRVHLLDPSPDEIDPGDVIRSLAFENRWNGQTRGRHGLSVAQHTPIVYRIHKAMFPAASAKERLAVVVHDFTEFLIRDLASPMKEQLGPAGIHALEERIARAIHRRVGLPPVLPETWQQRIKIADKCSAATEAVQRAGWSLAEVRDEMGFSGNLWPERIPVIPPFVAAGLLAVLFEELTGEKVCSAWRKWAARAVGAFYGVGGRRSMP